MEPDWLDLVRALKGSQWQVFTKVQLPGSLPYIFSGMKVAAILAIAGAVVGNSSVPSVASASGYGCDVHGGGAPRSRGRGALPDHDRARAILRR